MAVAAARVQAAVEVMVAGTMAEMATITTKTGTLV
jgi:hypothetical protein